MVNKPSYMVNKEVLRYLTGVQFPDEALEQLVPLAASLLADLQTLEELDLSQIEPALQFTYPEDATYGR